MSDKNEKTASVREMGQMLGLKKVESYWLAHKGFFKIIEVAGRMRVDLKSFEHWYAGQVKYKKVNGPPPGKRLKRSSYSPQDIAEILEVSDYVAYAIIRRNNLPTIKVDYWTRVPKEAFDSWYKGQTKYRNAEDRLKDAEILEQSLSLPEIARMLDIKRDAVYYLLGKKAGQHDLVVIRVAGQIRVTKESFNRWYSNQTEYLKPEDRAAYPGYKPKATYQDQLNCDFQDRQRKRRKKHNLPAPPRASYVSSNKAYLTVEEAALLAHKSQDTVLRWIKENRFPAMIVSPITKSRIKRCEFETYLRENMRRDDHGIIG